MAECHPVGFQWVVEAKERGATIIHVDPRFTRTSALADIHVPLRAGSDIAFLGGIVNYILTQGREFRDYVVPYTNAATIVDERFRDTEDLDGFFSGWDAEKNQYEITTWQYAGVDLHAASGIRKTAAGGEMTGAGGGSGLDRPEPPERDPTLTHPRCVFQLLKRHYSRYTPEMVEEICGVPRALFLRVAEALCDNSGRERTGAFCYAVGWTQHTVGVQYIRTAAVIQLLLGNIGRPGGGILALRGHASIQGSTDIPTLYDLLPGYIPMPHSGESWDLASYVDNHASKGGYWAHFGHYAVSLLKAWWGDHATADNDFCWDYLPRISEGHSAYDTALAMLDGKVRGYMLLGENPAVGSANSRLHRLALAELDWLVVRDFTEIESAAFWHSGPEIETGELRTDNIGTEVFFLPAAAHTEKDGSFTNTQRLLQWHEAAVEPPGDCRSDLWFMYHLGRIIREKLASSTDERDRPVLNLTWDYPTKGRIDEPDSEAVLREINGWDAEGHPLSASTELKGDGSTTCGCWIYCGCFAGGENGARRRRRKDGDHIAPEWGWAWPANRRMLYNRASADPDGKPWSERKRYLWWDADAGKWTGDDVPDFKVDLAPDHRPEDGATGPDALAGDQPFIMQDDGVAWLYVPTGLKDGPMPTHYEPHESPVSNPLYSQGVNPARERYPRPENPDQPVDGEPGAERYPYVMTTYRLTEHHTAGGMSRTVPHLLELQPEMFCEVSPVLAAERGLENGGWATIVTARTAIEARVLVTERIPALRVRGRVVHQVGLPYHFGFAGIATGDSANDLFPIVLDPNVHIQEVKAATCDVVAGRRPRGPQLREFVADHGRGVPR
ncbi:MAG: formate dehydrogenase major subunit [Actinomycetota bacterium]|nr:formate dehydrogenase major subunit [Actinomycetota bacterium]